MELSNDKTFEERGIMPVIDHPAVGKFKNIAWPVRFGGTPPPVKASPLLGEHTDEVLTDWLGLDPQGVGDLRKAGIVG